jgi:hypothetical protein
MLSYPKKLTLSLTAIIFASLPLLTLAQVGGQRENFVDPIDAPAGVIGGFDLVLTLQVILNGLLVLAGITALFYLIICCVRYIVSQGDSEAAVKARTCIIYTIIGLVVIGLAAVLVNFTFDVIGGIGAA